MIFNSRVSIFFLICSSTIFLLGCKQKESLSDFTQVNNRVEIKNSKVRAVFKKENGLISQIFYAKKNSHARNTKWGRILVETMHLKGLSMLFLRCFLTCIIMFSMAFTLWAKDQRMYDVIFGVSSVASSARRVPNILYIPTESGTHAVVW